MINSAPNGPRKKNGELRYKQGNFIPMNKDKVIKLNSKGGIYYRSGYELKIYKYMDINPNIIKWGAEFIKIRYTKVTPKKTDWGEYQMHESEHTYFPDVYYELMDKSKNIKKIVGEIKPYAETKPPKVPKNANAKKLESFEYAMKMYNANLFKWEAAIKYCESREMKFVIITELYFKMLKNG